MRTYILTRFIIHSVFDTRKGEKENTVGTWFALLIQDFFGKRAKWLVQKDVGQNKLLDSTKPKTP
jgi:hypothetical protein